MSPRSILPAADRGRGPDDREGFVAKRTPEDIMAEAEAHKPIAAFVGMSGGDDSLCVTHWAMNNVPGCQVFHINTGIGIERTRQFVRDTCMRERWPLHEINAKEDCGQDYEQMVLEHGFPGPPQHTSMYRRLKERAVYKLVKRAKVRADRLDRVLIITGIRQDESARRNNYGGTEVSKVRAQVWVKPLYWWSKADFGAYVAKHNLPRNPVAEMLGMSGECLCGAFAHSGEKALIRIVDPATADRIDALEERVRANGHEWGWEDRKPKAGAGRQAVAGPLCMGCGK